MASPFLADQQPAPAKASSAPYQRQRPAPADVPRSDEKGLSKKVDRKDNHGGGAEKETKAARRGEPDKAGKTGASSVDSTAAPASALTRPKPTSHPVSATTSTTAKSKAATATADISEAKKKDERDAPNALLGADDATVNREDSWSDFQAAGESKSQTPSTSAPPSGAVGPSSEQSKKAAPEIPTPPDGQSERTEKRPLTESSQAAQDDTRTIQETSSLATAAAADRDEQRSDEQVPSGKSSPSPDATGKEAAKPSDVIAKDAAATDKASDQSSSVLAKDEATAEAKEADNAGSAIAKDEAKATEGEVGKSVPEVPAGPSANSSAGLATSTGTTNATVTASSAFDSKVPDGCSQQESAVAASPEAARRSEDVAPAPAESPADENTFDSAEVPQAADAAAAARRDSEPEVTTRGSATAAQPAGVQGEKAVSLEEASQVPTPAETEPTVAPSASGSADASGGPEDATRSEKD